MNITVGSLTFRFQPAPTLLVLCLLPVLVSLGFWQLGRSEEKQLLLDQRAARANESNLSLTQENVDDPESLRYRKVIASGQYDTEHQFLLDNQIVAGKVGYFVFTPFIMAHSDKAVLVNRGWIPLQKRSISPDVTINDTVVQIKGRINNFPGVGFKLQGAEIPSEGWPAKLQLVDVDVLSRKLGYPLFSFQIELDPEQPEGYVRDWKARTIITPEKHIAYAIQWFGLAMTLLVMFLWFSSKKKDE